MTFVKKRIVVVVKTYPNLSRKYVETVCIGGIAEGGTWIRIFPIRFRELPLWNRFSKFDVIEAEVEPTKDKYNRIESNTIKDTTIKIIGKLPTKEDNWKQRKDLLLSHLDKSIESLESERESKRRTMGIIKPKIIRFYKKPTADCREWEKALLGEGEQKTLGGEVYKSPLEKIPYWIGYEFKCDDESCTGHNMMCEDWELLELFRRMKDKFKDYEVAFQKVYERYVNWMQNRDVYFIVGTESKWNNFLIISVFYPPK